jgi:hypothetical protein
MKKIEEDGNIYYEFESKDYKMQEKISEWTMCRFKVVPEKQRTCIYIKDISVGNKDGEKEIGK